MLPTRALHSLLCKPFAIIREHDKTEESNICSTLTSSSTPCFSLLCCYAYSTYDAVTMPFAIISIIISSACTIIGHLLVWHRLFFCTLNRKWADVTTAHADDHNDVMFQSLCVGCFACNSFNNSQNGWPPDRFALVIWFSVDTAVMIIYAAWFRGVHFWLASITSMCVCVCSIGRHRICCLKCGHLFGRSAQSAGSLAFSGSTMLLSRLRYYSSPQCFFLLLLLCELM